MNMLIEKKQRDKKECIFDWIYFRAARDGFREVLKTSVLAEKKILVPAYIGYSTREGSGVFDPIRESGKDYLFYHLDNRLRVDFAGLKEKIIKNPGNILLLIDYFGFRDENLKEIKELAIKNKMIIVEDFAHAFFSFMKFPIIDFDYGLFSIHKMFPEDDGGLVLQKRKLLTSNNEFKPGYDLFKYDLDEIARRRCNNYDYINDKLQKLSNAHNIDILFPDRRGNIPQTFPILLVDNKIRDDAYFKMNERGYGVVSLYHTMIAELDETFIKAHDISRRILNLPVHQDVKKSQLDQMLRLLIEIVEGHKDS